jgi:hypothetical protein
MYEQARGVTSESSAPPKKKLGAKRKKDSLGSKQPTPKQRKLPHEEQERSSDRA